MARDYINIGPTPPEESCEQVGVNYNSQKARTEMSVFIRQLRRVFGPEPDGAILKVKTFPHDFGSYSEVVCMYDDEKPESVEYAFKCESETPANWDSEAKAELKDKGYL